MGKLAVKNFRYVLWTLLYLDWPRDDQALIFTLVEHLWDTTHTFHFLWGEMGLNPQNYSMLSGISIGDSDIIFVHSNHETSTSVKTYFLCLDLFPHDPLNLKENKIFAYGVISTTWHFNRYMRHMKKLHKDSYLFNHVVEEDYAKSFLFYVVGNYFFKARDSDIRFGWMVFRSNFG